MSCKEKTVCVKVAHITFFLTASALAEAFVRRNIFRATKLTRLYCHSEKANKKLKQDLLTNKTNVTSVNRQNVNLVKLFSWLIRQI